MKNPMFWIFAGAMALAVLIAIRPTRAGGFVAEPPQLILMDPNGNSVSVIERFEDGRQFSCSGILSLPAKYLMRPESAAVVAVCVRGTFLSSPLTPAQLAEVKETLRFRP